MSLQYSSIAIFDFANESTLAISTISVTPHETALSGAWVLPIDQREKISLVLADRLAIPLSPKAALAFSESEFNYKTVSLSSFFAQAKRDAIEGQNFFEAYRNEDLKKRKNLTAPSFFNWQDAPDLQKSSQFLQAQGLVSSYEGTSIELMNVLPAARLVKFFIDRWQSDENARSGRKYIGGESAEITILPTGWLN